MCASSRLANPGARPCLASRSCESRRANPPCASSRFAKPPCELLPNVRQRQDFAVVRSWAAVRGNILASCIPEGASDGKSAPSWQHIAAMYPKRAGIGKIRAPCIRKALQIAFRECMARRSCQGGALFAALTPRIMHTAQILPGSPHCTDPSPQIIHDVRISLGSPLSLHRSLKPCIVRRSCHPLAIFAFRWRGASLKDGEFRFHCFGGARSSVLVRRTIPPCHLGYGTPELLGLRHPCLAGKSPVTSLSSARLPGSCLFCWMVRICLSASAARGRA